MLFAESLVRHCRNRREAPVLALEMGQTEGERRIKGGKLKQNNKRRLESSEMLLN